MSGHNKWSKIKRKKEVSDAQKSKVFSKLVKLIQAESKKVAGDINSPALRAVVEKAKKENMPKDNIEKALKKGASGEGANLESVTYEVYGPGGVGIVVEALTDNRNRTGAEIKHILSKNGLGLSAPGSVSWAYDKIGSDWKPKNFVEIDEEDGQKLELIVEALEEQEDVQEVFINVE